MTDDVINNGQNSKPPIPIYININNFHFNKLFNIDEIGQSCILASYTDFNKKILSFNDTQKLFIEFLLAVYNLFVSNNFGF